MEDRGWRWSIFSSFLPSTTLLKLASVVVGYRGIEEDTPVWKASESGLFSVRSAYELAAGLTSDQFQSGWKPIWRLQVQERIKIVIWMLAHNKLLTNEARRRRDLAINEGCSRC